METGNLLKNEKGLTLIEVLSSVTILSIVLLAFLHYFLQANTFTNQNIKKTVGVNVARNALMYIQNDRFLEVKKDFSENPTQYLLVCKEGYTHELTATKTNCSPVEMNNLPYTITYTAEENPTTWKSAIPMVVTASWEINGKSFKTVLKGDVKSEDIR